MNNFQLFPIQGLEFVSTKRFVDKRGYFQGGCNIDYIKRFYMDIERGEEGFSYSKRNVLRGLHIQANPFAQNKVLTLINGKIFDVVVDLRKKSLTYKHWFGFMLDSSESSGFLFIPKGLAHGYYTLSEDCYVYYKFSEIYCKAKEIILDWDDKELMIEWPLINRQPVLSKKDEFGLSLDEVISRIG